MTKVIGDYPAAVTIDGSTNYLLIQPGTSSTAYNKINRNTLLGVSGQPADLTTVQTVQNKIVDNSNTVTLKDTLFKLQDNLDVTKQAQFELSGLTTATTRTYTLPDTSTTLVGTGATQTLTSKTLTSPTITGGTYDNGTITVDAIGGHTSANIVTVAGLQINNGALNSNNSVVTANITDGAVTPAKLQSGTGTGWSWTSWTPTWTNLTVGNGTVVAAYIQIGKMISFRLRITWGSTTSASGTVTFSLPATMVSEYSAAAEGYTIGTVYMLDATIQNYQGFITNTPGSATTAILRAINASATYGTGAAVTATVPFTWGTADTITASGSYEAA